MRSFRHGHSPFFRIFLRVITSVSSYVAVPVLDPVLLVLEVLVLDLHSGLDYHFLLYMKMLEE